MPTDEQRQIGSAVEHALEALKQTASDFAVSAADFNALLAQAKNAFPDVAGVLNVAAIEGGTNIGELKFKLSLLHGPIKDYLKVKPAAVIAAGPRRATRSSYLDRF